jgi:type 1 glutamine amidotransferase
VDQKDYPMAFVLNVGKGRVFHSPLGHDVKAFNPAALELFRRGTAWAAGKPPTP